MKIIKDGETLEGIGPGVWWTYKNKYYELIEEQSKSIAVYHYDMIDSNNVSFKNHYSNSKSMKKDYSFKDTRIVE